MARQVGTNIDMLLNQLLNVKFQVLAADPGAPVEGQFWYNSTTGKLKYRDATTTLTVLDTAALAGYAPLASPALTGNPTAPTAAPGDNDTSIANTAFVQAAIAALVASAPGTLDTLNELAAALGNDPNFATTLAATLATKAGKYTTTVGGSASFVITHNLNTRAVIVSVHDATTFDEIECDVQKTTVNTVTLTFSSVQPAASRVVTVHG